jgi:hypothetical protein
VDVIAGNIIWAEEPYAAGKYPDRIFFIIAWLIGWVNSNM